MGELKKTMRYGHSHKKSVDLIGISINFLVNPSTKESVKKDFRNRNFAQFCVNTTSAYLQNKMLNIESVLNTYSELDRNLPKEDRPRLCAAFRDHNRDFLLQYKDISYQNWQAIFSYCVIDYYSITLKEEISTVRELNFNLSETKEESGNKIISLSEDRLKRIIAEEVAKAKKTSDVNIVSDDELRRIISQEIKAITRQE